MRRGIATLTLAIVLGSPGQAWPASHAVLLQGKWVLEDSSLPLEEPCRNLHYEFRADGVLIGGDGFLEERKSWVANPIRGGFLVSSKFISNNGKKNYQGLDAQYVKTNTIDVFLVSVEASGARIRLYFGRKAEGDYLLLRRVHDG